VSSAEIKCLDKGYVRLVDWMGQDLSVVRAARVSYAAEWRSGEDTGKDARLVKYMYEGKHTSPFEHVVFTFEVKEPIFVFRQWHRHRTWSYNELSSRYAEMKDEWYLPDNAKIGKQSKSSKQARDLSEEIREAEEVVNLMEHANKQSYQVYQQLLEKGVPRELARSVLPVAMYSKMFATVDLHNLFHFCTLRMHEHAQYEIRVYAQAMFELVKPLAPVACGCFEEQINEL